MPVAVEVAKDEQFEVELDVNNAAVHPGVVTCNHCLEDR